MDLYVTQSIEDYWPNPETPCWRIAHMKPDGSLHLHIMPKTTLAARSVEYGIDPADAETLWDIAIHEPFMVHPYDLVSVERAGGDPAFALGLVVPALRGVGSRAPGDMIGVTCHTARTPADARAAHLARLGHCKSEIVTVADPDGHRLPALGHSEPAGLVAKLRRDFTRVRDRERAALKAMEAMG
jgi:hypothetical protein